jgi:23S rRNA (guanosine2251-2'-O)-methyltransferase
LKDTIDYLKASGVHVISCTEKTKNMYYDMDFTIPTAIIMGSEDDGISSEYIKRSDDSMAIPMVGDLGSLNVSVAAGIVLFEAVKQRIQQSVHSK